MAVLVFLVLFLAITGRSSATYCLCKDGLNESYYQKALDYACGAGADCSPIIQSGACYSPNTVKNHCDFAVNSYFQKKGQATGTCEFAGTAVTSASLPSQSQPTGCVYQSSPSTSTPTTPPSTTTPSTTPPSTTTPSTTPPSTTTPSTTPPGTTTPSTTPTGTTTPSTGTTSSTPSIYGTGLGPSGLTNTDSSASGGIATFLTTATILCFSSFLLMRG